MMRLLWSYVAFDHTYHQSVTIGTKDVNCKYYSYGYVSYATYNVYLRYVDNSSTTANSAHGKDEEKLVSMEMYGITLCGPVT